MNMSPTRNTTRRCANCKKRPGTERWGDALAMTHGLMQMWCEVCVLEAQIAHARARADALPELEAALADARANTTGG